MGLAGGVFLTLLFTFLFQTSKVSTQAEILAEVGGERLSQSELRKKIAVELIPIENDEYRVLGRGVEEWVNTRLIEKEAKAQGVTPDELYRREVWSRVQVSYGDILEYYNRTRELYDQPFEKINAQISQEVRRVNYARAKEQYLKGLYGKYNVKIHLKKPASFVEGLALPTNLPAPAQGAGAPPTAPTPLPAAPALPAGPVEQKSEIGSPPSWGPAHAPITLTEFSDFHCPFCKKVIPTLEQVMKNYAGKVRWVYHHYPLSQTPGEGSHLTHEAAVCAQEQGKFWQFHDAVFDLPGVPGGEADLQGIAQKIGLDASRFQECLKGGKYRDFLEQEVNEGNQKGVQGTPTVFVNDQIVAGAYPYDHFVKVIEGILNPGQAPPIPPTPAAPPKPAPPPVPSTQAVSFKDLDGRPSFGPKNAKVTLVEFSDFHCPFCKRVNPTLEQLMKNYQGKIRRIWRQYPLPMHAGADRTAEASECANEQDKFWEYHDKLFEVQGASSFDEASLMSLAEQAGLNKKKFEKCLASGKHKDLIQKEIEAGNQAGVRGTPAVFVNGRLVSGAQPYENFDRIVQSELAKS